MFPKALNITVVYKNNIPEITKTSKEDILISEGSNFVYLLFNIFSAYPKIQAKYPPGKLGFLINGNAPKENYLLKEGDVLEIINV